MANIVKRENGSNSIAATKPMMPFEGLVNGILQNTWSRFFDDDLWGFNGILSSARVPVNIRETDKSYEMEIVAPGVRKDDFKVNISGDNMLTISFEHKEEEKQEDSKNGYLRQEYSIQSFSRSFTLDDTVNADAISARYKDGVLHVNLPKKEGAQRVAKTIQIK